jgi:transporter family protein
MASVVPNWALWALGSAAFAALTAIFGKIGVEGIDSNLATFIRTCVIVGVTAAVVTATGAWRPAGAIEAKTWLFLVLSALATGGSWLCYYRALKLGPAAGVAPIDKLSVVLVAIFAATVLGEKLSAKNWLGVGLVGAGALLLAIKG